MLQSLVSAGVETLISKPGRVYSKNSLACLYVYSKTELTESHFIHQGGSAIFKVPHQATRQIFLSESSFTPEILRFEKGPVPMAARSRSHKDSSDLTAYELEREARISRNKEVMGEHLLQRSRLTFPFSKPKDSA